MDSFKFNTTNYPNQTYSLVDAQNKLIEEMKKDNKVLSQDRANYAVFRSKETQRQLNQLQNIISGLPKLKKNLDAWKEKREEGKYTKDRRDQHERDKAAASVQPSNTKPTTVSSDKTTTESSDNDKKNLELTTQITTQIQDSKNDPVVVGKFQEGLANSSALKQKYNNTGRDVTRRADEDYIRFAGEGQAMLAMESGNFGEVEQYMEKFLSAKYGIESFKNLSHKNQTLYFKRFLTNHDNYRNQASRTFLANTRARYKAARATDFLDDIDTNPSLAVSNYLTKHQNFDGVKNTSQALFQLQSDIEYLEDQGLFTYKTYEKLLNSNTVFQGKEVKLSSIDNRLTKWLKGRKITLSSQAAQREKVTVTNELRNAIEQSEKEFEQLEDKTPEELSEWRATRLTELIKEHSKSVFITPYHELFEQFKTGMTRLDGPEHSTTVDRLIDMSKRNAPIDDELFNQLPTYYKNQYYKAVGGADGAEGSPSTGGIHKPTFKSMYSPIEDSKESFWYSEIAGRISQTEIGKEGQPNGKLFKWIFKQGQDDWIRKFNEIYPKEGALVASQQANTYIADRYDTYKNNPIPTGYEDVKQRINDFASGKTYIQSAATADAKLTLLDQKDFLPGEQRYFNDLKRWAVGVGEFPQYYRQIDLFKDLMPGEIALRRLKILQAVEQDDNLKDSIELKEKGVVLQNKVLDNMPLSTARLLTFDNTPGRTYRASWELLDNAGFFDSVKVNDDPNAYKPRNPFSDHVPKANLSEMTLHDALNEAATKNLDNLGLYGLMKEDIKNVVSQEEIRNGFLDQKFDEKLQGELKRRIARIKANKSNSYGALVADPNPLSNIIQQDFDDLTSTFGTQDWFSIPPEQIKMLINETE